VRQIGNRPAKLRGDVAASLCEARDRSVALKKWRFAERNGYSFVLPAEVSDFTSETMMCVIMKVRSLIEAYTASHAIRNVPSLVFILSQNVSSI
jgi:hypothetical protein